jgi:hypothetical protein
MLAVSAPEKAGLALRFVPEAAGQGLNPNP